MRIFKWTPAFNPRAESSTVLVWVRFPGLPIHLFDYHALYTISTEIGNPLQVDIQMASKQRLSLARVCIELDLLKDRVSELHLEFDGVSHDQKIDYEKIPSYCPDYLHVGHSLDECYMNGKKLKPPAPDRTSRGHPPAHRPRAAEPASDPAAPPQELSRPDVNFNLSSNLNLIQNSNSKIKNPNEWRRVSRKSAKETGFISKQLLTQIDGNVHTSFDEADLAEKSQNPTCSNSFGILINEVFENLENLETTSGRTSGSRDSINLKAKQTVAGILNGVSPPLSQLLVEEGAISQTHTQSEKDTSGNNGNCPIVNPLVQGQASLPILLDHGVNMAAPPTQKVSWPNLGSPSPTSPSPAAHITTTAKAHPLALPTASAHLSSKGHFATQLPVVDQLDVLAHLPPVSSAGPQ